MTTPKNQAAARERLTNVLPCWCRETIEWLRVKAHIDHGEFGCRERAHYVYCSNCWTCGPAYATDAKAIEGWNKMRSSLLQQPAASERCVCSHPKSQHEAYSDHDECLDCRGLDEPCSEFRAERIGKYVYPATGPSSDYERGYVEGHKAGARLATRAATGASEDERRDDDSGSHWRDEDGHCVLCGDDLGPTTEADVSPAPVVEGEGQDDGWVTFGRVRVDIENETQTFERIDPPEPSTVTTSEAVNAAATEICDYCGIDSGDSEKVAAIISKHIPSDVGDVTREFVDRCCGEFKQYQASVIAELTIQVNDARANAIREAASKVQAMRGVEYNSAHGTMTGVVEGGYVSKSEIASALQSLIDKKEGEDAKS
jgi:hypothetical protein